jgi:glycosyltransferase involved in cell wall biosynthesis
MSSDQMAPLAAPPPGRTGWPWMTTLPTTAAPLLNGKPWPRISVITPSYNQGEFLEQTIRSVLLQGYPNLEYIIIDGGSSDDSVKIIEKYAAYLTYWTSEPDRGQSHAINKGFKRSTGQIMCWLNSDDYYLPNTLMTVAESLASGTGNYAIVGHCVQVFANDQPSITHEGKYENLQRLLQFWKGYHMHQPAIFWRREVFDKIGFLDENQHYIMDFDYWVRMARHFEFKNVDRELACFTYHDKAKTGDGYVKYSQELRRHSATLWPPRFKPGYWSLKFSMIKHLYCLPFVRRLTASVTYRTRRALESVSGDRVR